MSNNKNPYDLDGDSVKNKSWDQDVVRAKVIDALPDSHAVRVKPRGESIPIIAPVLTLTEGSHTLPKEGQRVILLYVTDNTPVALGGMYLADGTRPPDVEKGDLRIGNETGSHIDINADGSIEIRTGGLEPVDIYHQSASVRMSTDQIITGDDTYQKVQFDTVEDDPENLFNASDNTITVRHFGQHSCEATVEVTDAGQNNQYTIGLFVNDTLVKRTNIQSAVNQPLSVALNTIQKFESGDELDIRVKQNSGADKTINSENVATEFSIQRHGV